MGCGASSTPVSSANGATNENYDLIINGKCPHVRLDHGNEMKLLNVSGEVYKYTASYCYVSQRGYYPNALGKANQDSYVIAENILKDESCHLFGVFDGHGEFGDYCSHFAADTFPNQFAKELKSSSGTDALTNFSKMESIYKTAFVKTNRMLHKSAVDDTLSGTTGVTVVIKGDVLYVGNVGDSRAIIASDINGTCKFSALSNDQTPFRKDERDRLRAKGATIMTLDQIEGNEPIHDNWGAETGEEIDEVGDPPRVWDSTLERPGCAFTRSIGDHIAEKVGVFAEPELLTWKLSPSDKFAIIASDGVFEFLTSQAVVDMVVQFKNPLDAAKHIVAEAYRLWLTYDDRTDDITIIIVMFDNFEQIDKNAAVEMRSVNLRPDALQGGTKPIRAVFSKEKRKVITENWDVEDNVEFDFESNAVPKTEEEMARIGSMVSSNFMFAHLNDAQRNKILTVMKLRVVKEGELIIKEGDKGDELYVIDEGIFTVHKNDENGVSQLVFTYTTVGAVFGELSLMYGKPRLASVYAKTGGRLWSISRLAFRASLMKKQQAGLMKTLKSIPVLNALAITQLQRICERTNEEIYKDGEIIVSAGAEVSWAICVILCGGVLTRGKTAGKKEKSRGAGAYIGAPEIGAVVMEAKADGKTTVAMIPMDVFVDVVGSNAKALLKEHCSKTNRGAPLARKASVFSNDHIKRAQPVSDFKIKTPIMNLGMSGEFGYVAIVSTPEGVERSAKFISKVVAVKGKMDKKLVDEMLCLGSMNGHCDFVPKLLCTCQDSKVAMVVYESVFVGDLSMLLSTGALNDLSKEYYAACLYTAMEYIHAFGLMHRYINKYSVYITNDGVPMIADMRYAKKMDGAKAFTVCGDPLYFAPEIITQRGYDYGADIWSFGCLLHDMYEGNTPFGGPDTEETTVFKAITGHVKDALVFSDNTPKPARDIMNRMIHPVSTERLGYSDSGFTKKTMYFNNVNSNNAWPNLAFATKQVVSALITPEPYDLESTSFRNNHAELTACSDADNALFACF